MLRTSTKTSIKFTIFTTVLLLFFWFIVNLFYFSQWYQQSKARLEERNSFFTIWMWLDYNWLIKKMPIDNVLIDDELALEIINSKIFFNISYVNNQYVIYSEIDDNLFYTDVSYEIYNQLTLLLINLYIILIFILFSYIASIYFVKYAFKNLNILVSKTKDLDLNNLPWNINIKWPDDDEIKILADTINKSINKINKQAISLKDFISNASHELKTPLMEMSTQIDLSNIEEEYYNNIKNSLNNMNNIIDNLLLLSKLQAWDEYKRDNVNLNDIIKSVSSRISNIYSEKNINLIVNLDCDNVVFLSTNSYLFEILFKNILENAFKYTDNNWKILVTLTSNYFSVEDNGIWIDNLKSERIRESFYQIDTSKNDSLSFWLWLYIVSKIVKLLWFKISLNSELWKWTKFTVDFFK